MLYTAKEDMVHWAVDMNFHESARDQFVNAHLYGPMSPQNAAMLAHIETIRPSSQYHDDESSPSRKK